MLARLAHDPSSAETNSELRELWTLLDESALARLAQLPYLLADMRFRDERWWQSGRRSPATGLVLRVDPFPRSAAIALTRAVLILAWNGLRSNPEAACVLYGINVGVARFLVRLTLDEIDNISRKHFRVVRPRWEDRPAVWRELILAAQGGEPFPMRTCNLHALRLLTGEILESAATIGPYRRPVRDSESREPSAGPTDVTPD